MFFIVASQNWGRATKVDTDCRGIFNFRWFETSTD